MTYGAADELVPFAGGQEQISQFRSLGYRFHAVDYPAEDHLVFAVQNDFTPADSQLGTRDRTLNPGSFTFSWYPDLVGTIDKAGRAGTVGPTSDYWISGLSARNRTPGALATVMADSRAIAQPAQRPSETFGVSPFPEPTPAATDVETWVPGPARPTSQNLRLGLTNVARVSVDTARARLRCAAITVSTDGRTVLTLLHLRPDSTITSRGVKLAVAGSGGSATVRLSSGTTVLHACSGR